jgi:hypothetical protein
MIRTVNFLEIAFNAQENVILTLEIFCNAVTIEIRAVQNKQIKIAKTYLLFINS